VKLGWRDQLLSFLRIKDAALPSGSAALQSVLNKLRSAVSIKRKGLTYLISVSATSVSPTNAADLANAVASAYITANVQAKVDNILIARNVLQSRINSASKSIVSAEQAFDVFIADNIDTITRETGRTDIGDMRKELDRINATKTSVLAVADLVSQNISLKNWVAVSKSLQDEALSELQRQRDKLNASLVAAATGSQKAINLRSELAKIDQNLLIKAQSGLSALKLSVAGDQAKASELRQQIRTSVVNSNLPADILAQIYQIQQNSDIARSQYQTLISRVRELDAQAQTQISDVRIVSKALPPSSPSYPNKKLILALAGMSALGLGVGLALLYENILGGFVSEGQIENVLKSRVVATVPHVTLPQIADRDAESISAAELMLTSPLSPYAEAIRRLRAGIDNDLRRQHLENTNGQKGAVIMLSSAVPKEGKSTIALSLGRAYALSGSKTVLIDCDLRKPSLHKFLNIKRTTGLADYLADADNIGLLRDISVLDKETSLSVIVGSKRSDMPTDHFSAGAALERLINSARKQFDYVILDTPPIVPVVDGLYLAAHADVIVMVVRWATTSQGEAKETINSLQQVKRDGTDIISVMNQQERSPRGYRYKYAGYYGSY